MVKALKLHYFAPGLVIKRDRLIVARSFVFVCRCWNGLETAAACDL